ncbi:hypothetical protein [Agrobacterium tumefaciens]|nr:hypothetical protein [Agrobacterium tumefaciens]
MAEGKAGEVSFLMPDFRCSPAEKGASCIPQVEAMVSQNREWIWAGPA